MICVHTASQYLTFVTGPSIQLLLSEHTDIQNPPTPYLDISLRMLQSARCALHSVQNKARVVPKIRRNVLHRTCAKRPMSSHLPSCNSLYIKRIQHFRATLDPATNGQNGKTDWNATKQVSQNPSRSIQPQQSFQWKIQLTRLIWSCRWWWVLSFFFSFATSALESVYALHIAHSAPLWFFVVSSHLMMRHPRLFPGLDRPWIPLPKQSDNRSSAPLRHIQKQHLHLWWQSEWHPGKRSPKLVHRDTGLNMEDSHRLFFESFAVFTSPYSNLMGTQISSKSLSVKTWWSYCIPIIREDFPEKVGNNSLMLLRFPKITFCWILAAGFTRPKLFTHFCDCT